MIILKNKEVKVKNGELVMEYIYRLTKEVFSNHNKNIEVYGVEIERKDYIGEKNIKIERDGCYKISPIRDKVEKIMDIAAENNISPIHFIDIFGEKIDKCVNDF